MKYLFTSFALLIFSFNIFCQNLTINCEMESGKWNHLFTKTGLLITKVSSSGKILEILIFDSEENAELFLKKPNDLFKPIKMLDIDGIPVYIDAYTSIKYYSPNEYNSGKIKEIGGISFNYFFPNEFHSGKLKQIGDVSFNYYNTNEYNSGKLKQIENILFSYYAPNEYNSGKVKQIGAILFSYYTPNEYNSGKLKQIGHILFNFYTPNEYNSGKFKELIGTDKRIRLI